MIRADAGQMIDSRH